MGKLSTIYNVLNSCCNAIKVASVVYEDWGISMCKTNWAWIKGKMCEDPNSYSAKHHFFGRHLIRRQSSCNWSLFRYGLTSLSNFASRLWWVINSWAATITSATTPWNKWCISASTNTSRIFKEFYSIGTQLTLLVYYTSKKLLDTPPSSWPWLSIFATLAVGLVVVFLCGTSPRSNFVLSLTQTMFSSKPPWPPYSRT